MSYARIETIRTMISGDDIDPYGHAAADRIVKYGTLALGRLYHHHGIDIEYLIENGIGFVAVEQIIEYKRELLLFCPIGIFGTIRSVEGKILEVFHEIFDQRTNNLAVTIVHRSICMDLDTRRACEIPDVIRDQITRGTKRIAENG